MLDDQPNTVAVLLIILVGLVMAVSLAVYGCSTLARSGDRGHRLGTRLRGCTALAGAAAVATYVWGAVHLVRDESMTDQVCKNAASPAQAAHISGVDVSYLPLHLNCHVTGGGSFTAAVPDYVNPLLVGLGLATLLLAVFAALASELRTRADFTKETKR